MSCSTITFIVCLFIVLSSVRSTANENAKIAVSLNIENADIGLTIPPIMHGVILETNINRGDDGGLYAELIYNRAFQG